ncbi:LPS-assembly protein LptD [Brucella endophytica]|uniref:LPS-assembly protein LptD n=1 Tax=Brucella endophytica TaxID=1963359 RepID=A0A916SBP0_9HYPH|nr:LPS-assembly protein LptD [Brucella endophytica]GGA92702.1 LPS-assembly protein LptD [Brucella endophytica]
MGLSKARTVLPARLAWFLRGTALACALTAPTLSDSYAQAQSEFGSSFQTDPNAKMVLQANELVYDNDAQAVTAQGAVRIEYDGNRLVADKVTYNQRTNRMLAEGNVEIVEKDGNRIYSDKMDVTDDFRDGFVNSLRVETTDNTRFVAESAERSGGEITTFNNGIYTACEACKKDPTRPMLWQVKARKIIWNGTTKTVRFERGRFEMFGMPLAYFPAFEMADPTVKRKSGFLFPGFRYDEDLGFGVRGSYFWNLAPNYDLTFSTTAYTQQGFLGEVEWRHRLENGSYNLRIAGIHQNKPDEFGGGTVDQVNTDRGMVASKGKFEINPRWTFGWNVIAQSDKNFSRTYGLAGYSDQVIKNEVYLSGLGDRSYFNLHFYKFNVQESVLPGSEWEINSRQPWVLPSIDYSYVAPEPVYGGELNFDMNVQGIYRENADFNPPSPYTRMGGINGTSGRITGEAEWKRTFMAPGGLVITPLLALRGDGIGVDSNFDTSAYQPDSTIDVVRSEAFRVMATAGLEMRWPILFSTTSATHVIEPMAQIFLRNNERYAGQLPNEDAQSFVFDATTLFQRDKFSGYDRVEGGHRANLGIRYSGNLNNDWSLYGLAGQSFQLGGVNSFAESDFVNVGAESGLETARSDYVAMIGASNNRGLTLAARGRFDEETFELRRGELEAAQSWSRLSVSMRYAYIDAQPQYGYTRNRQEVGGAASLKVAEHWSVFGGTTYDLVSETLTNVSAGFAYDDECFTYSMTVSQTRNPRTNGAVDEEPKTTIGFNIAFRTLGDFGSSTAALPQDE